MSQRCYECGRESPFGGPLRHFEGCSCDVLFETDAGFRTAMDQYKAWLDARPDDGSVATIAVKGERKWLM